MRRIEQVDIETIRSSFREDRLEFLVGAGPSIDAGLPTWSQLNNRLLRDFFDLEFSDPADDRILPPEYDELEALARIFVDRFGREPAVDVIRGRLGNQELFRDLLHGALYSDRAGVELKSLQYELASSLHPMDSDLPGRLITTNFDNYLERAYCYLHEYDPDDIHDEIEVVASASEAEDASDSKPQFVHLHGYLPETGRPHGRIVLSERDFFDTESDWPTDVLEDVLNDPERDLLIVGMSMADPRLRKLLLQRAESAEASGEVYVLLAKSTVNEDALLAERRAHKLLHRYELQYWERLGVKIRLVSDLEKLPMLLRKIRLGDSSARWCSLARDYLERETESDDGDFFDSLYTELKQREALVLLSDLMRYARRRFEVDEQEDLSLGFFVPSPDVDGHIQLAFRHNDRFFDKEYEFEPASGGAAFQGVPREHGRRRRLKVETVEGAEGAAGYAYARGTVVQALHSSAELNRNFTDHMLGTWDTGRTFSSLLCVPIYGGSQWLPLGVGFLSSHRKVPFWTGLPPEETLALHRTVRSTFKQLVGFSGHHG
jgi:hypothetical protein